MNRNAAASRNIARDCVGILGIAALGESHHIIFGVLHAHFAGMMGGRVVRLCALFVGLPNFVGGGFAGVGLGLFCGGGFVNKALVVGAKPGADFLAGL